MFDEKFETNGNGKSNAKADGYSGKGKGEKGDKGGSRKKKEPPKLLRKVEEGISENLTCLMDCEPAQFLQEIQEHMVLLSKDPSIKIPISFDRALQYESRGEKKKSKVKESLRSALTELEKLKIGMESTKKAIVLD